MYARVKRIGSKRYAYLAEGVSKNGRVRQRTVAYLGPLVKMATGVPDQVKKKVEEKTGPVDWNKVNVEIRRIPLGFRELQDIRRNQLPMILRLRQGVLNDGRGSMRRAEGELAALAIVAKKRFNDMFEPIGERIYRMRIR